VYALGRLADEAAIAALGEVGRIRERARVAVKADADDLITLQPDVDAALGVAADAL
jgi:hypothetical protein